MKCRDTLPFVLALCAVTGALPWPARDAHAAPVLPPGYRAEPYAQGLTFLTAIAFDGDGRLYAAEANLFTGQGRVLLLVDANHDGFAEASVDAATGLGLVTGLAFDAPLPARGPKPDKELRPLPLERIRHGQYRGQRLDLFVSHFTPGPGGGGTISRLTDRDGDGDFEGREDIVKDLPSDGVNGNQQVVLGPDGLVYFGQGGRTNSGVPGGGPADTPLNGTVLRVGKDGSGLTVFASGLRNCFDLAFLPSGEVLATENGPDASGPNPIANAPDELNALVAGGRYGWPDDYGFPALGSGTLGPIAAFESGSSSDGIAYVTPESWCGLRGDLLVAQFGSFTDPGTARRLVRVRLVGTRGVLLDEWASGFGRPLDLAFAPDGSLYVSDFSDAFFSPGTAQVWRIFPEDLDENGTPDVCE